MGSQEKTVFVIMTNGDVMQLTTSAADNLMQLAFDKTSRARTFKTVDAKTGKVVVIFIDHISTIVGVERNA